MAGVEAQRVLAALDHAVEGLKYALVRKPTDQASDATVIML
jgi:hypothetical protein